MQLKIKNTLSGKVDVFKPLKSRQVSMYHCGPTVYNKAHIGNLSAYVLADVMRRYFEYFNYKVKQVINITDVGHLVSDGDVGEDKMEKAAKEKGLKAAQIAKQVTLEFLQDLEALNIELTKIIFPRATQYINEQIELIEKLEKSGFTYKISDGIYFDTSKKRDYGKLGNINLSGLEDGARIGENSEKKNSTDFALWKFSDPMQKREQEWQSPWGIGFPGWHIECSAMIEKILGLPIDIHTGGIEHIPVHHNNEIAQTESATNKKLANYWLHRNHILINNEKISKSLGNTVYLNEITNPLAFRYWLLTSRYETQSNYTNDALNSADTALTKLKNFVHLFKKESAGLKNKVNKKYLNQMLESLSDNFDTPKTLALIWTLMKDSKINNEEKVGTIIEIDKILGLNLEHEEKDINAKIPEEVIKLAEDRKTARNEKNWAKSDQIRAQIESLGYTIIDENNSYRIEK